MGKYLGYIEKTEFEKLPKKEKVELLISKEVCAGSWSCDTTLNKNEIIDNGIDDDGNGYIDDIHGWNFLGNSNGENLKRETTELTRYYATLDRKYKAKPIPKLNSPEAKNYKEYIIFQILRLVTETWKNLTYPP